MKIALVNPPIAGHVGRGTGVYTQSLFDSICKNKDIEISQVNTRDDFRKFDLVHFPYFDPFFLTLPLLRNYKNIVTVHDLIPIAFPDFFPKGIRGKVKWQIQKLSLERSDAILTDSIASKKDIEKFTSIKPEKIHVIPLGVGEEFKIVKSEKVLDIVKQKFNLPDNFILHAGDVNPNKNILGLIRAFYLLTKSFKNLSLVLTGKGFAVDTVQLREINNLITDLELGDSILKLGFISTDELAVLYNLAKVYIQPSFAEGFGLPVLEAMACGCPTVVSNITSLTELTENASVLFDPNKDDEIAKGIFEILNNRDKKDKIVKKGLERVKDFSWDKCARETIKIYRSVISKVH